MCTYCMCVLVEVLLSISCWNIDSTAVLRSLSFSPAHPVCTEWHSATNEYRSGLPRCKPLLLLIIQLKPVSLCYSYTYAYFLELFLLSLTAPVSNLVAVRRATSVHCVILVGCGAWGARGGRRFPPTLLLIRFPCFKLPQDSDQFVLHSLRSLFRSTCWGMNQLCLRFLSFFLHLKRSKCQLVKVFCRSIYVAFNSLQLL